MMMCDNMEEEKSLQLVHFNSLLQDDLKTGGMYVHGVRYATLFTSAEI